MTDSEWKAFCSFREDFRKKVLEWSEFSEKLIPLQKAAAEHDTPPYSIENPVVYNTSLDSVLQDDDIRLIVIGDNPGKNEQLQKNRAYLVGQSGRVAEGFFRRNPELNIDFRKNAVILNKTPVHSAKTKHLKDIEKNGGSEIQNLIEESQVWFARKTAELLSSLKDCRLWLVGYAELKKNGIFTLYREELKKSCTESDFNRVLVYQHFSMNCFSNNLNRFRNDFSELSLSDSLEKLGKLHRKEIFGS